MDYKDMNAIGVVRLMLTDGVITEEQAAKYFPELKESKDERIRKAIYNCVKWFGFDSSFFEDVSQEECLDWLEKQGQTFTKKDVDDAYLKGICDAKHELEKQGEQKPTAWSEEDEKMFSQISDILWEGYKNSTGEKIPTWDNIREWCLSIKDRVQPQPRQEYDDMAYEMSRAVLYDKLKDSFSPQPTWKPSEEMLEAFEHFVRSIGESGYVSPYDNTAKLLYSLLADLKKLMEE